jgi:hypothetical protein
VYRNGAVVKPKPAAPKLKVRIEPPKPLVLSVPPVPLEASEFFFLWKCPDGSKPRMRHATLEAATAERNRLLKDCPEAIYYIFKAERCHV